MPCKKFGLLALTFILVSAVVVPALLTDIASAECSVVNCLTVVQLFYNPNDYKWQGSWDPRFDPDWQTHYGTANVRDRDAGCDRCAARDYERNAARDRDRYPVGDYERNAARDCDSCKPCASISGYRCDLYGCAWTRDYGCTSCGIM